MPDKKIFIEFLVERETRCIAELTSLLTADFSERASLWNAKTGHFPGIRQKPSQQIMLRNASYQLRVERLAACLMENNQI